LIEFPPSPSDNKWQAWAQRLLIYLVRARSILKHKTEEESASEDGVLLWDRENDYPTVSRNGVYTQVVLQGGHAYLTRITNVTAAASDTAYSIVWDTPTISDGSHVRNASIKSCFCRIRRVPSFIFSTA
jgi:hypothetical protein